MRAEVGPRGIVKTRTTSAAAGSATRWAPVEAGAEEGVRVVGLGDDRERAAFGDPELPRERRARVAAHPRRARGLREGAVRGREGVGEVDLADADPAPAQALHDRAGRQRPRGRRDGDGAGLPRIVRPRAARQGRLAAAAPQEERRILVERVRDDERERSDVLADRGALSVGARAAPPQQARRRDEGPARAPSPSSARGGRTASRPRRPARARGGRRASRTTRAQTVGGTGGRLERHGVDPPLELATSPSIAPSATETAPTPPARASSRPRAARSEPSSGTAALANQRAQAPDPDPVVPGRDDDREAVVQRHGPHAAAPRPRGRGRRRRGSRRGRARRASRRRGRRAPARRARASRRAAGRSAPRPSPCRRGS